MIDAAYTIRFDWALESDRLAHMMGAESTYLDDFLKEIEAPEPETEGNMDNITDLREWVAYVNRSMTGGE